MSAAAARPRTFNALEALHVLVALLCAAFCIAFSVWLAALQKLSGELGLGGPLRWATTAWLVAAAGLVPSALLAVRAFVSAPRLRRGIGTAALALALATPPALLISFLAFSINPFSPWAD